MSTAHSAASDNAGILFLRTSSDKLQTMSGLIRTCFEKLDEDAIWNRHSPVENSLGNLVLHLSGNVRQWIGSYVGGLEDIRDRPSEFSAQSGKSAAELLSLLEGTVEMAVGVLQSLKPERLVEIHPVQDGKSVSILEAIYHVVGHFQQHTGQIIYATKLFTSQDLGLYKPPSASSK
jgi:uncharacterized damage-inducible protein DinB